MAENYKHLYEQTKKMLTMYQDELIPGFRKKIEELEKNQVKVLCKDCEWCVYDKSSDEHYCNHEYGMIGAVGKKFFCSYGERKDND